MGPGGTTADGEFTLVTVNCLGACALGPVLVLDGKYHGKMTVAKTDEVMGAGRPAGGQAVIASATARLASGHDLAALRDQLASAGQRYTQTVAVCGGTGCQAYGCQQVVDAFAQELARRGLQKEVRLRSTGCHGFCERGPLAVFQPSGIFYQQIKVEDVPQIVEKTVLGEEIIESLLYRDPTTRQSIRQEHEVPFYKHQSRVVFGANGLIDPTSIEEYIAIGGYGRWPGSLQACRRSR